MFHCDNMLLLMLKNRFHLVSQTKHWVAAGTGLASPWHTEFGRNITCRTERGCMLLKQWLMREIIKLNQSLLVVYTDLQVQWNTCVSRPNSAVIHTSNKKYKKYTHSPEKKCNEGIHINNYSYKPRYVIPCKRRVLMVTTKRGGCQLLLYLFLSCATKPVVFHDWNMNGRKVASTRLSSAYRMTSFSPCPCSCHLIIGHSKSKLILHISKDKIKLKIVWWVKIWQLDERTACVALGKEQSTRFFGDFFKSW
jgi:hypothetical protein